MSLVYSEIGGLTVASHSCDEASVLAGLKQIDPAYRLAVEQHPSGRLDYGVVCYVGSNLPAVPVCSWRDEQNVPLPLSSGLVEKVRRLRVDGRGQTVDVEEANRRLVERNRAEFEEQIDDATRYRIKHKGQWRYFFGSSQLDPYAIRAARMKARNAEQ